MEKIEMEMTPMTEDKAVKEIFDYAIDKAIETVKKVYNGSTHACDFTIVRIIDELQKLKFI